MYVEDAAVPASRGRRPNASVPEENQLVLTDTQNWSSYSHKTLYESIHTNNDPGAAGELSTEWSQIADEISESSQSMGEKLVAVEDGWTGNAAQAARGAITELAEWSGSASQTASDLSSKIADQGTIMETARAAMPEPVEFDYEAILVNGFATGGLAGFAAAVVDVETKSGQARDAHEQAVQVMAQMESDSQGIDGSTPQFVQPPNPVRGTMTAAREPMAPMGLMTPQQQGTPMSENGGAPEALVANGFPAHPVGRAACPVAAPVAPAAPVGRARCPRSPVAAVCPVAAATYRVCPAAAFPVLPAASPECPVAAPVASAASPVAAASPAAPARSRTSPRRARPRSPRCRTPAATSRTSPVVPVA